MRYSEQLMAIQTLANAIQIAYDQNPGLCFEVFEDLNWRNKKSLEMEIEIDRLENSLSVNDINQARDEAWFGFQKY